MRKANIVAFVFIALLLVQGVSAESYAVRAGTDSASANKLLSGTKLALTSEVKEIGAGAGISNASQPEDYFDTLLEDKDIAFLKNTKINFNDGTGYDTYNVKEIIALGADSPSVETSLSTDAVDKNYKSDLAMEVAADSIYYYYLFDDEINVSLASEEYPLEIDILGHHLKIVGTGYDDAGNADRITVKMGMDYFLTVGDTINVEGHTLKLEEVGDDVVALRLDGGEVVAVNRGDTYSWIEGVEANVDDVFYKSGAPDTSAAMLIVSDVAAKTYKNNDAFIGEPEGAEDWRWVIANLDSKDKTVVTAAGEATGPVIGFKNHFVADDGSDTDPPAIRQGGCYDLTAKSGARLCMTGLTVPASDYFKLDVDISSLSNSEIAGANQNCYPTTMSVLRIRAKQLTRKCSDIRDKSECGEGVSCSANSQCVWSESKGRCSCYQNCGLLRGGGSCVQTAACPAGLTCQLSDSQDKCICSPESQQEQQAPGEEEQQSSGEEEEQYQQEEQQSPDEEQASTTSTSFTPLRLDSSEFPTRGLDTWGEGTTLTSDVETDEIYIYKYYSGLAFLPSLSGEPDVYLFYRDPDTNDITLAANWTATASKGVRFAYIDYLDSKDEDISLYFRSGNFTANYLNISANSAEIPDTNDNVSIYIYNTTREVSGGQFGLAYEMTHIGPTANQEEAEDMWYVNDLYNAGIGTQDEDLRTEYGIIIKDPETHCGDDDLEFLIPGDAVRAKVALLSQGVVSTGEESTYLEKAISDTAIADVSALPEYSVLVGGPAANKWSAYFMDKSFPTYGADLGWEDGWCHIKKYVKAGKEVTVIAGWDAADTSDCVDIYLNGSRSYNRKMPSS